MKIEEFFQRIGYVTLKLTNGCNLRCSYCIDQGRVVQQGTPEDLRSQPGLYRDLLEVQRV